VGSGIPIAAGVGFGLKHKKSQSIVATFFGDGAVNTGAFHEGMNLIALWKLPVLLYCENNQYAMSTPVSKAVSSRSIAERARAYNMETVVVNGNDVLSVYVATKDAAKRARTSSQPTFFECITYKMKGHGVYDKGEYRPREEVEKWLAKDPIKTFEKRLIDEKVLTENTIQEIKQSVQKEIEDAVKFATEGTALPFDEILNYVYAGDD